MHASSTQTLNNINLPIKSSVGMVTLTGRGLRTLASRDTSWIRKSVFRIWEVITGHGLRATLHVDLRIWAYCERENLTSAA